ncbi:MAG: thioesterase family protein [Henriciella sp.]|jgi:acyl-CoA thioesterase|nr:thioesterase family protein [Henriciella sp.]MBO6693871.1 thioesterase family protein [Henriciella sp.]
MTRYTELLSSLQRQSDQSIDAHIPESWMQGRTTYGGLTAALSLHGALGLVDDIPLRSAQVAFVGPVGGDVRIKPTLLRRGKNTAFVSVDVVAETGIAAQSIFAFGARRESALHFDDMPMPDARAPEEIESFFDKDRPRPGFTQNFDMLMASGGRPVSGSSEKSIGLWMRHLDPDAPQDATAVLAIGDAPPPAAMSMLSVPSRISSMTWMAEFMTDSISTDPEGWFYAQHTAQLSKDGYSSQSMRLWNRQGEPILVGRQTIAVFG